MNDDPQVTEINNIPTNAVSVYGSGDGAEEFPVLKAFQQYIDQEQSKARKRMLWLSIFFAFLMTIVISVGLFMFHQASQASNAELRNSRQEIQALNDKLLEFALRDREKPATDSQSETAALKALTETLGSMQKQLADANREAVNAKLAAAQAKADAERKAQPTKEEIEHEKRVKEDALKLRKAYEQIQSERKKLEADRKKLADAEKEAELERYRRKHYPELYVPKSPSKKKIVAPAPEPEDEDEEDEIVEEESDDETDALLDDVDSAIRKIDAMETKATRKSVKAKAKPTPPSKPAVAPAPEKDYDEYEVPVEVHGSSVGWRLPED